MITIEILDFDGDGKPEIAGKGSNTCEIIDLAGRVLWKYPAKEDKDYWSLNSVSVADADNDGRQDVVVGTRNGLELFGKDGKRKWTAETSNFTFTKPQVVDLDGDGKNEISVGEAVVDGNGELKEKIKMPREVFGILIGENERPSVIYFDDNKMGLFQSEKLVAKYDAPVSNRPEAVLRSGNTYVRTAIHRAEATYLKLDADKNKYLAVLADASLENGGDTFKILYIYNSEGNLVYHETIKASFTGAISTLPKEDGSESLLITAAGKLFKYSLN